MSETVDEQKPERPAADRRRRHFAAEIACAAVSFGLAFFAWRCDRSWFEDHLTQSFCATEPAQLHRLIAVRAGAIALALLVAFVIRPHLSRWLVRTSRRTALASTLRILLSIALALGISALILRSKNKDTPPAVILPPALPPLHPDPDVGWVGDSHITVMLRADDREIPYSFDADGNRAATQDGPDLDKPSIVFAGESITEGIGVRWEESYPAVVAHDLGLEAVEAASHGYGNDQIYWAAQKQLAKAKHPLAVVSLLIPQLLERDLDVTRTRLTLTPEGSLVKLPPDPPMAEWWKSSPLRKVAHGLFPYHDDSSIAVARAVFLATQKEANARGAYALFLMTNWGPPCLPPGSDGRDLSTRLFGGLDVHWVNVVLDPAWQDLSTHHPNAKAHRLLADAIEKALIDAKVAAK